MKYHLYFAACDVDGGIYHYVMENNVIAFEKKTKCDRPMFLDVKNDSIQVLLRELFQDDKEKRSGLLEYSLSEDGSLGDLKKKLDTKGIVACHLCRYMGKTFVANYLSGSVFSSDGFIRKHIGFGLNPKRQEASHIHFVKPSPDGKCLFVVDLGTDSIYSYDQNLQLLSTVHVPAGCGARHLAYAEDGNTVFCVNELAFSVSVFAYKDTKLELLQTVSVLENKNEENTSAAIRVNGSYVYVSNRGENSISCLKWDGTTLTLCSVTPCGGESPRDFLIVDDVMFVTNESTNNVTIFDVRDAFLNKRKEELYMPNPLCVVALCEDT